MKPEAIISGYSIELKLIISILGESCSGKIASADINPDVFIKSANRNRTIPWIKEFLDRNPGFFPPDTREKIININNRNTRRMLVLTDEMLRLQNLFNENNISCMPLKGPSLSNLLYNNAAFRNCMDIDFLVEPGQIEMVSEMMSDNNYVQVKPDFTLSPVQKKVHLRNFHHYYFRHKNTGITAEIHWKLITPDTLLPGCEKMILKEMYYDGIFRQTSPELLLHYLLAHGTMHRWYKLFWLKDIDIFIRKNLITDTRRFNELALLFGNKEIINQSFGLLKLLFNTDVPEVLLHNKRKNNIINSSLVSIKKDEMLIHRRTTERFRRWLYLISLKPGLRHLVSCIRTPMTNYIDWKLLPLPDRFFFLYYILRPFLWFWSVFIKKEKIV